MMYRISLLICALWLAIAVVLLGLDGRLVLFLALVLPTTGLALSVGALTADQRKASIAEAKRYVVADDLSRAMLDVVTDAETRAYKIGGGLMRWE
jgi:hypothetical protein